MLDVGCGIGGTCLHVAKKYDIQCIGITISPKQVKCAQGFATAQGLENKVLPLLIFWIDVFFFFKSLFG